MAGLGPAIHVFGLQQQSKTWMPGTSPGMTTDNVTGDCLNIVIASDSEAIQNLAATTFWIASSLTLLAMTSIDRGMLSFLAARRARAMQEVLPSRNKRAQGRPGAQLAPAARVHW